MLYIINSFSYFFSPNLVICRPLVLCDDQNNGPLANLNNYKGNSKIILLTSKYYIVYNDGGKLNLITLFKSTQDVT